MTRLAYFAFDRDDAATRRRGAGCRRDGIEVDGFAMRRRDGPAPDWVVADLGRTADNAYLRRAGSILAGARKALKRRDALEAADVMMARNLDMLVVAALTRRLAGLKTPLVYECLDVHRLLVREDGVGAAMRALEGRLLAGAAALWVSSPAFLREYFEPRHGGRYRAALVENRIVREPALGARPTATVADDPARPLRIGWFGNLRCRRSLAMMEAIGAAFPGRAEIVLRGYPALGEIPDFDARVAAAPAVRYGGRYKAPEDLAAIYGEVDVVWAGDFMDAGSNSDWLLPNRLYEGGWFACPPIAPAHVETGRWIAERGVGFTIADGDGATAEESLEALVGRLIED
ncbi:MAG: glycosyl transferase family 1, partial [Pseudomonadota bacterium]